MALPSRAGEWPQPSIMISASGPRFLFKPHLYLMKCFLSEIARGATQIFFNPQQLVVLCDAIGARERACFDLAGVGCNREIGDERIFSFTGTVRNDRRAFVSLRELDAVECFRERADLVDLDQNRVCDAEIDSFLQKLGIGDEEIVANELYTTTEFIRQQSPPVPIVFAHAVFYAKHRTL